MKKQKNLKISIAHGKNPKFNKRRGSNKAVGPGKKSKIINVGSKSIPESRV